MLLDFSGEEKKGIGFIIPHKVSDIRLEQFMVSIDSVEAVSGIDFFLDMINDIEEEKLESQINKKMDCK
ncbi:MAG: hypothetical protein IPO92_13230 [Saprospiraceae bacterium]|nr:hypothetical protein [Saprospiraceae bacterium]